MRVPKQHVDQRAPALFQAERDGPATKTRSQRGRPTRYRLWRVIQFPLFLLSATGRDQTPEVLLVGPVDGCKRSPFRLNT